eukprot:NODE_6316_length_858_cov_101.458503_g6083_i0.p1 GENE.NODE_6316_length_858_cov_101.458503_g6083_i0~~NODE_6316_length_858_cov_101.458503_g6083_i0.p1  ORF type:complete len:193 (-),score=33.26 NODE_6316_length_858_cov_101.458503_g6083_i0:205-783(-)
MSNMIEVYLRGISQKLELLRTSPSSGWLEQARLLATIQTIVDVAEIGRGRLPDTCARLMKDGATMLERYRDDATDASKKKLASFEAELESATRSHGSFLYQQLLQHYRFLQRFDELVIAACLMGDGETVDSLVTKVASIRAFLKSVRLENIIEDGHLAIIEELTSQGFQFAVDASLSIHMTVKEAPGLVKVD